MVTTPSPPRSRSSSRSGSSSPPPQLDPNTLAILAGFLSEKDEADRKFQELSLKAEKRRVGQLDEDVEEAEGDGLERSQKKSMMSVDEFRKLFGEDWQLSQFWYSATFASRLSTYIHSQIPSSELNTYRVAFLCCPTGYVGFQHQYELPRTVLMEFDKRFELLDEQQFVHYDIDEPEQLIDDLKGNVDFAVCDPPFLNEVTNRKLASTLRCILKPNAKLLLLTSTSVEHLFESIYDGRPVGPLSRIEGFNVEHAGGIQNDFGIWKNW